MTETTVVTDDDGGGEVEAVQAAASLAAAHEAGAAGAEAAHATETAEEASARAANAEAVASSAASTAATGVTADEAAAIADRQVETAFDRLANVLTAQQAPPQAEVKPESSEPAADKPPTNVAKKKKRKTLRERWEGAE
jgi:hypothetical protein